MEKYLNNWRSLGFEDDLKGSSTFKKKYKSSLGWESGLSRYTDYYSSGRWFSSYSNPEVDLDEVARIEVLLKKAYSATRDMIVILNFPYDIKIQLLTNSDDYYVTDEKVDDLSHGEKKRRVFINTTVINNKRLEDSEKINIMCGLGIHESAHLLYTEYSVISNFSKLVEKDYLSDPQKMNFLIDMANVLEDSRIEDKLLTERPGFLDFIECAKKWSYESFGSDVYCAKNGDIEFIKNFFSFLRFPEFVDNSIIEKHSELFSNIGKILSESNPENTKGVCILAKKIFSILLSSEEINLIDGYGRSENVLYQEVLYGSDKDGNASPSSSSVCTALKSSDILKKLVYGKAERGSNNKTFFEKMKGDKSSYDNIRKKVEKLIPSIRNIIRNTDKNYDFVIHGCRSGLLDTTKLAEAYQGVPQVYIKQGKVVTNRTTVCILIDESGSMYGNKCKLARESAILLNESLGSLPGVDLYIYGHSADEIVGDEVDLRIYREKSTVGKYSLSQIKARCQNRDGDAILETAKRVRKFTSEKCIMLVISDGDPCAGDYYGKSAVFDTRKKVLEAEKLDFDIIQISIDEVENTKKMFSKYINLEKSLEELPKKLGAVVKKVILDNKKSVIV